MSPYAPSGHSGHPIAMPPPVPPDAVVPAAPPVITNPPVPAPAELPPAPPAPATASSGLMGSPEHATANTRDNPALFPPPNGINESLPRSVLARGPAMRRVP